MTLYYPHQAAEIVKICCAAGIPEEAVFWLSDGYSVEQVALELRSRSTPIEESMRGMLTPKTGQTLPPASPGSRAAASVEPSPANDWAEAKRANAERFGQHQRPGQ